LKQSLTYSANLISQGVQAPPQKDFSLVGVCKVSEGWPRNMWWWGRGSGAGLGCEDAQSA